MPMPSSMCRWLRLPSRIALLFGVGALSVAGAEAGPHPADGGKVVPQQSAKQLGDLHIWQDEGRIFISEAGRPAEELRLGNSPEADLLRERLRLAGATRDAPQTLRDRIILVGSGGSGLHWEADRAQGSTQTGPTRDASKSAAGAATDGRQAAQAPVNRDSTK
jgi:hypothetical protein